MYTIWYKESRFVFCIWISSCPTVFIEKSILSLLNFVAPLLQFNCPYICWSNKPRLLISYIYIYQWNREKMYVFVHTLSFQFRWYEASNFVLSQICFCHCKSFEFPFKFWNNFISLYTISLPMPRKKLTGILIGIALNLRLICKLLTL